jgi:hypothetical protein
LRVILAPFGSDPFHDDPFHEEAHRRRCDSLPAAITIEAEADSQAFLLGYLDGSAAWLAKVVGGVQASATRARFLPSFLCEILINGQKKRPEPGGPRQIVIYGRVLRCCGKPRSTPLKEFDPVIRLFEGNFLD